MKSKNAKSSKEKHKAKENENNKRDLKETYKILGKLISKINKKKLLLKYFQIWTEILGNDKIFMYNGVKALDIIENSQSEISLTQIEQNKLNKKNDSGKKESNNANSRSNDNSLIDDLNKMKTENHSKREPKYRNRQMKENKFRKTSYSSKNSVNKELKNSLYEDELEDKSSSGRALALKNKKIKNKKEISIINPEYQNIINRHNKDKSLRYKNYLYKIKRTQEIDRLSLTNIKSEILAEKNKKKLMNIVNIKKCHEDKLMNYFDKWFERTYMPEKKHKKVVKKIKKKKHVDKKLSDLDDTKNDITSSNDKNSDFKDKSDDNQVKSFGLEDPFKKIMKKKKSSKKHKKLNLTMQLSSGNIHKKSYKKIIKTSFDMKDNNEISRRNSQHVKIRNLFNGLNKNNNEEEMNKKYKYRIIRGIYILSKIFKDHQKSDENNSFKKWINQAYDKMKETKMKKNGDIPKKNSSENSIKHRKKNGKKYSEKLKLKKVIDMITQSQNHNSKIIYFNKWKNNNPLDETFQTFGKEVSNKNEDSEELNQKYKSIKNEQAIKSKLNDIINKKIIKINDIKKAYLEKWIRNKNIEKSSKNTIEEESSVTISSNLSNINKKDDESSFSGYIIDYAKNNMLREININKINKVVQNKVEKQEKCFLKVVSKPNNNNNIANDNYQNNSIEENREKQIKINEGDKHILGQISIKAQAPSQIKGGLPPQKNINLGQISSKAQAPAQVKGGLPPQKNINLGQISSKAQAPSQVKGGLPPQKNINLGQISSKAQAPAQVKGGLPPQKNINLGQISSKAQAPSQVKGGLPPQNNNNKINNNMISEKPNKIVKKEFLEDKKNIKGEEEDYTINNDLSKKDFFEEELRNSVFKNLAINDFRGTVIKKADNNNMDDYNNINNNKYINDNMINRHKDDNSNFLKEKQKIQPPKQVLEFNSKKNNNNDEANNNRINIRNRYQNDEQMKNKENPKTRERKINRYYYRSKERKRDKKREKLQKENDEEPKIIPNNVKEMDFSPNKNKINNNHRNIRNKKRAKLSYVINKIDSLKDRKFYFKKWKDFLNDGEKSDFEDESEVTKKYKKEEEVSSQNNNVESELIFGDSVDTNLEGKKIDNQNENENEKNNGKIHKNTDNKSNTEDNSFHSEITENDYKENRQKYNIINEITAKSNKILNTNLNFLKKDKNSSHTYDIYLSLLIKNCKSMAAYRIFCLYSSFNKKIDILRIRKVLNMWKKVNKKNTSENENNSYSNSNSNSNSNCNSNNDSNN